VSDRARRTGSDSAARESTDNAADAVDETALASLLDSTGDAALVQELIDVYLTDTAERVVKIRQAAARGDITTVRRVAHTLRGSSATIGARDLAALGHRVEHTFTAESADGTALLERLAAEFERVRESLRRRQEGRDPV
jgi:HPt (histidine-containing phosphotransfer) domain-containing protein